MAASLSSGGTLGAAQTKQLGGLSKRIIELLEQRDSVNQDIAEVFNEAKEAGFETKILRKAIKRIRADQENLKAEEELTDAYVHAIQPDLFAKAA